MSSYSLLEEVWDKPLVENQDLLVSQRAQYGNPTPRSQSVAAPLQTYSSTPQQFEPQVPPSQMPSPNIPQSFPPRYTQVPVPSVTNATAANTNPGTQQRKYTEEITPRDARYDVDLMYTDRIRTLEEQIARLERTLGSKQSSVVSDMISNNDLLMYMATGAFFIFVMDNIAKISKSN